MLRYLLSITAAFAAISCTDPAAPPPPRFQPNPPYPPQPVDPYVQSDPYAPAQQTPAPPPPSAPGYVAPLPPEPSPHAFSPQNQVPSQVAPTPPATPRPGEYPFAERTANPGQVKSPYPPHKIIDVSEFKSGQLARDPWNQKIFRIP